MQSITLAEMSKSYGGVPALSDVTLTLRAGRVHALMGENGAGKSTLIRLAAGVVAADRMRLVKDGVTLPLASPQDAHDAGFRFIHQEMNIVPQLSVAENILLGRPYPRRFGLAIDWPKLRRSAQAALGLLGASHIDPRALAGDLPAGDKMLIRIAAALVAQPGAPAEVYVLDEPTAALTGEESEMLFSVIERLKAQGAAILYVSHRMDEVLRLSDDVTVLRDGRHVWTRPVAEAGRDDIILAMTGRDLAHAYPPRESAIGAEPVATLRNVETTHLAALELTLRRGEILGVAGLAESGQTAFLRLFLGLEPVMSGQARLEADPLPRDPSAAWARGIAYVPRERREEALMLDLSVRANTLLPHLGADGLVARRARETARTKEMAALVRLKYGGPDQPVRHLSGGNQQKVVFARALCGAPRLLLLDEPTRGVDVGAKYDIYELVRRLSAEGCAVILASSDLPELLGMCDRILVLHGGRQTALLEADGLTPSGLLAQFYAENGTLRRAS